MVIYDGKIESTFEAVNTAVHTIDMRIALYCHRIHSSMMFKINFMLREMMNNAVEHGNHFDKNKWIHCLVELVDDHLCFHITDQGDGIKFQEECFQGECAISKSERNRGYATVRELNFDIEINHNTVKLTLKLQTEDAMEKIVDGNTVKLILEKDLTANNIEQFRNDVDVLLKGEDDMAELVIDLVKTQNIDSVGVTFIISLYKRMKNEGILFRITGASNDVKSLFKLMKLDQFFDLED